MAPEELEIFKKLMNSIQNKGITTRNKNYIKKQPINHETHSIFIKDDECKNGKIAHILYCNDCATKFGPLRIAEIKKNQTDTLKKIGIKYIPVPKRPEAIVYRWIDKKTNKQYIGSHELSPKEPFEGSSHLVKEGIWLPGPHGLKNNYAVAWFVKKQYPDVHTGYVCSSKDLLVQMKLRPTDFTREVLATGSTYKMRKLETKLLQEINVADNPNYYNKHNNNKIENCLTYHKSFVCQELDQHFSLRCVCDFQKLSDITLEEAYILEQEGYPSIPEDHWSKLEEEVKRLKKQNKLHKSWSG